MSKLNISTCLTPIVVLLGQGSIFVADPTRLFLLMSATFVFGIQLTFFVQGWRNT